MIYEFKLPDIGEGLTEGEVVKWHVKEGDLVREDQPLVSVLTDKAEVEIPSPKTGKILKLMAQEGEKVKVHAPLVSFELEAAAAPSPAGPGVSATPAVRKLAAELKVELAQVRGTGPGGRLTEQDVRDAAGQAPKAPAAGPEERVPFVGIRRRTSQKMAQSARTVAHVTHMDEADWSALVSLHEELKEEAGRRNLKLTYLPFILKALAKTLKEFPNFNATLDEQGGAIVRKLYYNIGIATSAPQGLLVPVVKDAGGKDLWQLAGEIARLAEKARSGRIELPELQGGTFTVTNIGPIGGLFATPIVNHPEVAILGVMKIHKRPVVKDGGIVPRDMGNLVLSFDHRVIDGAEAAQFMNTLVTHLENPRTLL